MNTKKKCANGKQQPLHTIRCGEITASIYRKQSNSGYAYMDYDLARHFVSLGTGKETQGSTFFPKNLRDLKQAAEEASNWIRERMSEELLSEGSNIDVPVPQSDLEQAGE